jgi:hypothetical protein
MQYSMTVRGINGCIDTLVTLMQKADITGIQQDPNLISLHNQHPRAYWAVRQEETVEFDIYNTARISQYRKVRPHRTDTHLYRSSIGSLLTLLVQAGYTISAHKNKELEDIEFSKRLNWEI